jgi:hypothetical protein
MIILPTQNLQKFLHIPGKGVPLPDIANLDALWHGNIFFHKKRKVIHLTHEISRYTIFIYGITQKDLQNLPKIINAHLYYHIIKDQIPQKEARYILDISENFSYFKRTDKKVLGAMNHQKLVFETLCEQEQSINDKGISHKINHMIFSFNGEYYTSSKVFKEYFQMAIEQMEDGFETGLYENSKN